MEWSKDQRVRQSHLCFKTTSSYLSILWLSFECWIFSHFIWSHRGPASLGNCPLHLIVTAVCVIPSQLISSHIFSAFFTSPHLFLFLSCSPLITAVLFSSYVTWAFLIPSHLSFSMLFSNFTALLKSSQLSAAHVSSSYVFPSLLSSPHIFYKSSSRTKLISALASSSHLISALPWSKTCSNYGSRRHFEQPLRLPRNPQRRFDTEKLLHTASFLTREACTHRSFHTEAGKLLHRDREAFTQSGKLLPAASFYTEQAFGRSKLLHGNLYIEKLLHAGSFYTQQTFTHTQKLFFGTQKLLHEEAFTQRSYHTHTH